MIGKKIRRNSTLFSSVRGQSLSNRIVSQVLEALFSGELQSGHFLGTEAQLAEMFNTSRVPIREALGRLEALGVVTIRTGSGGGVTIAEGNPDQFGVALAVQFVLVGVAPGEIFDARIAIESRAAELAAENISDEELLELREMLDVISRGQTGRLAVERILKFHVTIVKASGSRTLLTLMHALKHALTNLYLEAFTQDAGAAPKGYVNLEKILQRLEARDPPGALLAMREHLLRHRERVIELLRLAALEESQEVADELES